jgi:hypothetical protein
MVDQLRIQDPNEPREHETEALDASLDSPVLRRLIDEVRSQELDVSRSYNRTYNRHNR